MSIADKLMQDILESMGKEVRITGNCRFFLHVKFIELSDWEWEAINISMTEHLTQKLKEIEKLK